MSEGSAFALGRSNIHTLYRALYLTRAAEERLELLRVQGHVAGDVHRSGGREAGAVGAAYALRRKGDGTGDFLAPTAHAAGALFLFGGELVDFFRQCMARETGPTKGKDVNANGFDRQRGFVGAVSSPGTMLEVMAGVTLSFRLRGEERVGVVFCGPGASSTGAWHEGLCFAAAQGCPLILVAENSHWAYAKQTRKNTRVSSLTEMAAGYGVGARSVDGTDVLAVFDAVRRAAALARAGGGTQMVELRYLWAEHDSWDGVDPALIAEWEEKDSIQLFRARLLTNEWASEHELVAIEEDEFERSRLAAERAIGEPGPYGPDAVENVYSDVPVTHPWARADVPDPALA